MLWEHLFHGTPPSGLDDRMLKRCLLANKYMLIFLHVNISCFYWATRFDLSRYHINSIRAGLFMAPLCWGMDSSLFVKLDRNMLQTPNFPQTYTIILPFRKSKISISLFPIFADISIYLSLDMWNMWRHRKIVNGYNFLSKQDFFIKLPLNETNSFFFHFRFVNSIKQTYFAFFLIIS